MIKINVGKRLKFSDGAANMHVNIMLQTGAVTALYGPSGAGKTTLLKIIAGLTKPDEGKIEVNGIVWHNTSRRINLPPQQRSIGFVFQDYALFPHMTILQNLHFAGGKTADENYIRQLLELVNMQAFINTKPAQLSGGQQQRAALIRALVRKPQLLLLDEPLSAIDDAMRRTLHTALSLIQQQLKITILLVSHSISEIFTLASHCIQLQNGQVTAQSSPQQLFGAASLNSTLQLIAEVLHIAPNGAVNIVTLSAGNHLIKITANDSEIAGIQTGDKVLVYAETFNAAIKKLTE